MCGARAFQRELVRILPLEMNSDAVILQKWLEMHHCDGDRLRFLVQFLSNRFHVIALLLHTTA